MSKIAFIYPGQGAQAAGMGADFYENSPLAREVFDQASEMLDMDMKALCFEKNDRLDITEYTQPAMVTTCLAMTRALMEQGLKPDMTAGLSLGEYCAISAAGGMTPADAIRTVRARGILMQNAVPVGEGAMAAILGMDPQKLEEVMDKVEGAAVANYNCPGQIVITGKTAAVNEACLKLKEAGAKRAMLLNVSGPFHSPMLENAGEQLGEVLETITFHPLIIPYVTNVHAVVMQDISQTKELLKKQISSSVYWQQSVETMIAAGVDTFVEIGPGKTLTGFIRKISKEVKTYQVNTWEDIPKVMEAIAG